MTPPPVVWPFFGLRLVAPTVELVYPDDAIAMAIARLGARGIHDPATMPFAVPWTRNKTPPELALSTMQNIWLERATATRLAWNASFAVVVAGEVVGRQDIQTLDFPIHRTVTSGSWIGQDYQGRGIGRAAREAILAFAFDGLDAAHARTGAFHDNPRSLAVSRRLGYVETGRTMLDREGVPTEHVDLAIDRAGWAAVERAPVAFVGLEPVRAHLGLGAAEHDRKQ